MIFKFQEFVPIGAYFTHIGYPVCVWLQEILEFPATVGRDRREKREEEENRKLWTLVNIAFLQVINSHKSHRKRDSPDLQQG